MMSPLNYQYISLKCQYTFTSVYSLYLLDISTPLVSVDLIGEKNKLILEYKKRILLRCIHHFKSDLNNTMDHMRISGNEP